MVETHNYRKWFFGSDRVLTIIPRTYISEPLFLYGMPVGAGENEWDMEKLDDVFPSDMPFPLISISVGNSNESVIVCDIPDNYALFLGNIDGDPVEELIEEDAVFEAHWSKR